MEDCPRSTTWPFAPDSPDVSVIYKPVVLPFNMDSTLDEVTLLRRTSPLTCCTAPVTSEAFLFI
ncbi:hypothetical protein D3C81_1354680 [compost metagenome]